MASPHWISTDKKEDSKKGGIHAKPTFMGQKNVHTMKCEGAKCIHTNRMKMAAINYILLLK